MDVKPLSDELSVSPQLAPGDMRAVAAAGFRAVICNRPDGEGADQPGFSEIERAAHEQGLEARYLPAVPGKVTDEQVDAFGKLMSELPKPVLAFCRTGMRSTTLWALSQAGSRALPQIIERATQAGFDLKDVVQRIANGGTAPAEVVDATHDSVIVAN